jgi:hypothetical protein
MRRASIAVLSGLLLAGVASAVVSPTLSLRSGASIRGSHFRSNELVRVMFGTGRLQVRRVHTNAAGSFAAVVPSATKSCSGLFVRAVGASGDHAVLRLPSRSCSPDSSTVPSGASGQPTTSAAGGNQTTTTTSSGADGIQRTDGLPPNADGVLSHKL